MLKVKIKLITILKALIMAIKQAYFQKYQYFTNFVRSQFLQDN